jgi:hypothetical protein
MKCPRRQIFSCDLLTPSKCNSYDDRENDIVENRLIAVEKSRCHEKGRPV